MAFKSKLQAIKEEQIKEDKDFYAPKEKTDLSGLKQDSKSDNLFEQLQAAMQVDIARLKAEKKLEDKVRIKSELLPNYFSFVNDYVEQGYDYPCDVAVQVMVWMFDVGDIEAALTLGLHLIAIGNQKLPKQFNRDIPTFIADAMYDWANEQLKNEQTASPYLDLFTSMAEKSDWDLHPAVISKNLVMMAKHKFREGDFKMCVKFCEDAEKANPKGAGVKTLKGKAMDKVMAGEDIT